MKNLLALCVFLITIPIYSSAQEEGRRSLDVNLIWDTCRSDTNGLEFCRIIDNEIERREVMLNQIVMQDMPHQVRTGLSVIYYLVDRRFFVKTIILKTRVNINVNVNKIQEPRILFSHDF